MSGVAVSEDIISRKDAAAHIGTITINRPAKRNAVPLDMVGRFCRAIDELEREVHHYNQQERAKFRST